MNRLDVGRYRALVIFTDGTYKFASNHTLACEKFQDLNGHFPSEEHVAGFLEVSVLREVSMFFCHDENKCREVMESAQFIKDLHTI